jgi:aspartokinase-like uncharacterized kinase
MLIVPGGGPFADAVRAVDRSCRLPDDASHWMAVLAMDQYAFVLAARLAGARIVEDLTGIHDAISANELPVLAPFRWLRTLDPLPHSWDVTSDSIAAWVATHVHSERLVLVKPPEASGDDVVDRHFDHVVPAGVRPVILPADRIATLAAILRD